MTADDLVMAQLNQFYSLIQQSAQNSFACFDDIFLIPLKHTKSIPDVSRVKICYILIVKVSGHI